MLLTRISIPRTGLALVGATLLAAAFSSSLLSAGPVEEERDTCLGCHGDQTASKDLPDGTKVSLFVDATDLDKSVHGTRVKCSDCHPGT
jgi:nitrate reductase cytochrome c-type subunit